MSASAWSTIASLATALGTLVLAVATFSAVRSSNQRVVSRFTMLPIRGPSASSSASQSVSQSAGSSASPDVSLDRAPEKGWMATASRHWNIDRPDPR